MTNPNPNLQLVKRLENLRVQPTVQHLYWLALQGESSEFEEFLDGLLNTSDPEKKLKKTFPGIEDEPVDLVEWDGGYQLADVLKETGRHGFLAEIHIPETSEHRIKEDGSVGRFRVSGGISQVEYCYGETLEDLVAAIETRANAVFAEEVEETRKQNA